MTQTSLPPGIARGSCFVYPAVRASYVGGTILGMPLEEGSIASWPLRVLGLWSRQYRVHGHVAMGTRNFIFAFKKGGTPELPSGSHFQVLPCDKPAPALSNVAQQACDEFGHGASHAWMVIQVPYDKIVLLSRAKVSTGDLASISAAYGAAATSIVSSVVTAMGKVHTKELYGGITAGSLALGYYYLLARPRSQDNYIALFVCPPDQQCSNTRGSLSNPATTQTETDTTQGNAVNKITKTFSPDALFTQGDVIMFKVPNSHDYYNISMILSGKTGQGFIPETAEKAYK